LVIKTKSIYEPDEENNDGIRVLITRYYPRGVRKDKFDCWIRELSPSRDLLKNISRVSVVGKNSKLALLRRL
jgi:uncharacterized protein YeaO (DUF488 family)